MLRMEFDDLRTFARSLMPLVSRLVAGVVFNMTNIHPSDISLSLSLLWQLLQKWPRQEGSSDGEEASRYSPTWKEKG